MTIAENHDPLPFAETEFGIQPGFTIVTSEGITQVTGICPACGARTMTEFALGSPQGSKGIFGRARVFTPAKKITVYCHCGHVHPDRPESSPENGCGAFWYVELPS